MTDPLRVPARFNGPPASGNGGYCAGAVAERLGGIVEVTLRAPPPLEVPMTVERHDGALRVLDGARLVMEARPASLDLAVPVPPSLEDAADLSHGRWSGEHAYPSCFVCGPTRAPGDGLRIFPGRRPSDGVAAAPWTPDRSLAAEDERVRVRFLWAAMDCPGYFAAATPGLPALLGRMTAHVVCRPAVDEACVVVGWALRGSARKLEAGTAIFGADGTLYARARQTWIVVG